MEEKTPEDIYLEYGDIIKIYASANKDLHEQTFFIKYIDLNSKINLINTSTLQPYTLYYNEEEPAKLRDESIEEIHIIWKSPLQGYIAQNGLEPHKWVDIYFGGDFPIIFTGEITEIQDDQMEVTLYPSLEVIYIDFEYKGLPEDKNIEKIVIRSKPKYIGDIPLEEITGKKEEQETKKREEEDGDYISTTNATEPVIKYTDMNESIVVIPENYKVDENITDLLHNMYIDANDIIFDSDSVEIVNQVVEMDTRKKIYSLDEQVTNLLDEMLSTIPNYARTKSVMENIQRIITHFKYLRTEFSKMDEYGNIKSAFVLGLKDKPLVNKINKLSTKLKWIIPVVSLNKPIFTEETEESNDNKSKKGKRPTAPTAAALNDKTDIIDNLKEIESIQHKYFKNLGNDGLMAKYPKMIKTVENYLLPYTNNEQPNADVINVAQVNADIEAIIDNFSEFKTIVYRKPHTAMQKYVIQKYNLGCSLKWLEGKKKKSSQMTENETVQIKSFLMLPNELVRFSKIDLPTTSILTRSSYAQTYPMIYKLFHHKRDDIIERVEIPTYKKSGIEFDHEKHETNTNIPFLSNIKNFTMENNIERGEDTTTNQSSNQKKKKYDTFLQNMIPDTYTLISLLQKYLSKNETNGVSMLEIVGMLEPFAIYTKNITYNSYVRIRYFVKNAILKWKTHYIEKQKEYRLIREKNITNTIKEWDNTNAELLFSIFKENGNFQDRYYSIYNSLFAPLIQKTTGASIINTIMGNTIITSPQIIGQKTSQVLKGIMEIDSGNTMILLLRILMSSLIIPDELSQKMESANSWGMSMGGRGVWGERMAKGGVSSDELLSGIAEMSTDELEKIKPSNCSRRYLTKIYKSLRDLQNDNHKEIYYDKTFDKTPYELFTKDLKAKKEKMPTDNWLEYFAEVLVQKFGISREQSTELADIINSGKKPVVDGEYAILETYPIVSTPNSSRRLKEENFEESKEDTLQYGLVKTYYIRTKNVWKKDDTIINEDIFMDDNTLFCNLTQTNSCVKRTKTDVCQETDEARREILAKTRASLYKEFDERVEESIDLLVTNLETNLKMAMYEAKKIQRMKEIQIYKYNKYAYDLGAVYKTNSGEEGTAPRHSKWEDLLDKILSQTDFVKKQKDVLIFTERFTREPMVENLNESPYWFYCRETNLKLLPIYIYELAKAYVVGGSSEYEIKMKEVIRKYGTISDDGDSIVDGIGGSGRVIQKIDFVEEELYDDAGFKIKTKTAIEKELGEMVGEALAATPTAAAINTATPRKKERLFENETNEMIYNILTTLCRNMGISPDGIEDVVLRISNETIKKVVIDKEKYESKMKKMEKPKPYIQYKNQNIILIVGFVTFVAIQSAIPPFQPTTAVAGCVFSFDGFPLEGGEDGNTDGLRYLACVLNVSKSSIGVWASIQSIKNPVQTFMDNMIKTISKFVIQREDVLTMFSKKREYMILNPESVKIPGSLSIQKWTTFLPPIVSYKIIITPLPSDFFQKLKRSLTKGDRLQWDEIAIVKSKSIQYSFAIIDYINQIVKKNKPILNTISLTPFLQNACCNDLSDRVATASATAIEFTINRENGGNGGMRQRKPTVIEYFTNKEPNISVYANIISKLAVSLNLNTMLSLANIFVHGVDTLRPITIIPKTGHSIENIYQSFIYYGKFDIETAPIPEYLKTIIPSKPPLEYNRDWTMMEKIKYLKENGKNYSINELNKLLGAVNNNNMIENKMESNTNVKLSGNRTKLDTPLTFTSSPTSTPPVDIYRFQPPPNVVAMSEYLNYLDEAVAYKGVIEEPLKKHLRAVFSKYSPNTMTMNDNEEISTLKNYLIYSNTRMVSSIYDFLDEYGGSIETKKVDNAKKYIRNFTIWEGDSNETMQTVVKYTKNVINEMATILPTIIYTNKEIFNTVPPHWDLSQYHCADIENMVLSYYKPIFKFMEDGSIKDLLFHTMDSLKVLVAFANYIPVVSPFQKRTGRDENGGIRENTFYAVFDKETIYLLFGYLFHSVLYEYIQKSNDPDVINKDKVNIRKQKVATNEEKMDSMENIKGIETKEDTHTDEIERVNEIQLLMGETENIKKKTAELLVAFLSIQEETKKAINKSYKTVSERVVRSKLEEKKKITDYFKNMSNNEREVEKTLKMLKMGRWNVGMQKGVFEYDKNVYDNERMEIVDMLMGEGAEAGGNVMDDYIIQPRETAKEVTDLEGEELKNAEDEYDNEEFGIGQLGEDYMDGNYYGNDDIEEDRDFNDN